MFTSAPSRRARFASRSASASVSFTPPIMTYSSVTRLRNACAAFNHRLEIVLLLDRHDGEALSRRGGVERYRQAELLGASGELLQAGQDAHRGHGDVAGADAEPCRVVEDGERGVHRRPVEQRLAHPHEDDVGRRLSRVPQDDLADLAGDLEGLRFRRKPIRPVAQKVQRERAAGLGGDAERAAATRRDQHRLDRLSVIQPPEILPGAIDRLLDVLGLEPGKGMGSRARSEG